MARHIAITARIESVEAMAIKVAALADDGPIALVQDDTFFACAHGRVTLRTVSSTKGQLICSQRTHQAGPKASSYVIAPTASPDALRAVLSLAYGEVGCVCKHRTLYRVGRTRVHLERVASLGDVLAREVERAEGEQREASIEEANKLRASLGISIAQLMEGAYVALLAQQCA